MSARKDVDGVGEFAALLRALKERTDRSYGSLARRLAMNTSTLHRYCAGDAVPVDFAPVERFAALCGATADERLELHRRWLVAVAARQRPRAGTAAGSAATGGSTEETGAAGSVGAADVAGAGEGAAAGQEAGAGAHGGPDTANRGNAAEGEGPAAVGATAEIGDTAEDGRAARGRGAPQGAHAVRVAEAARGAGAHRDRGAPSGVRAATVPEGPEGTPPGTDVPAEADPVTLPAPRAARPRRPWHRHRRLVAGLAAACALLATLGGLAALPDGRRAAADGPARTVAPAGPGADPTGRPGQHGSSSPTGSPTPGRSSSSAVPEKEGKKGKKERKDGTAGPSPSTRATVPPRNGTSAAPLTWTADSQAWKLGCGHDYVITKPPAQVPPPPVPQDAGTWAATQGAVHAGETLVRLSVQGRTDTAVVLEDLRVRVVGRAAPVEGNAYAMDQGCGGAVTPRYFEVDLDKDRPLARAVAGSDAGTPIPAVRMPYRGSRGSPRCCW
ncbi:helix-turn-helix domain-containing protein [Streptomyces djakartensis]|uniref:helix-turn-helix domain-containing protein n=1 Tax=Streptomyces djakartensis TaxID=68193 RepID=UPI003F803FA6